MATTLQPAAGHVPPHLMRLIQRHTEAAMTAYGINPRAPGAGGLVLFNAIRGVMGELSMLPDTDKSAEDLGTALQWRTTAAIAWLGHLAEGEELSAQAWVEMRKYPNLLRECAAWFDALLAQYHEGDTR